MVLNLRQLRRQASITSSGLELDLPLVANSTIKYAGRGDLQVQVDSIVYDVSSVGSTVASHATLHTQHTASLATKVPTADGIHTGETAIANLVVGHTGNPEATCHIAGDLIVGSESTAFQAGHDNSNSVYLEGNKPQYVLYETGSVNPDERMWAFRSSGGELSLIARTDNDGSGNTAMSFDRSGSTITTTNFGALTIDHTASPPAVSINGNDIQLQIDANGAALVVERGRLDVLIDSGTALDQISEMKAAWESGDGSLNSAITGLTTTAATDRAAIRAEHIAADSALSASLAAAYQSADTAVTSAYVAADAAQSTALTNSFVAADGAQKSTITTEYQAADAAVTSAYQSADAVVTSAYVAADAAQSTILTNAYVAADGAQTTAITTAYQAADTAITTAYLAADAAQSTALTNAYVASDGAQTTSITTAYQAADTALVSTLNGTISSLDTEVTANESAISALQTTVNTTHANLHTTHSAALAAIEVERSGATITDVNFGSLLTIDHVASTVSINGYDIQSQITENWDNNGTQDTAISLNTNKNSYTSAASNQVAANVSAIAINTPKVGFTAALVATAPTVTANTAKLSYTSAASNQVAANVSAIAINTPKVGFTDALVALAPSVAANTAKLSYTDEAQVITNKGDIATHETRHDGHDTSFATKLNTSGHQTMNGRLTVQYDGGNGVVSNPHADDLQVYHYSDAGITIGAPEGKIGTLAFSDQNKADRNQIRAYSTVRDTRNIGMHFLANQVESAVPTLSVVTQLVGINNAQPTYTLDVAGSAMITSTVFMPGLPESDPGVAGQLYVKADGLLRISTG